MKHWPQVKLQEIVSFKTGKLDSNAAEADGKYPFFTCSPETLRINSYAFDTTAILLAGNNATGVFPVKYYSGKFNCYQRTYVIENIDPQSASLSYLYFAIQLQLKFLQSMSIGATTKFLTTRILNNLKIPFPPLPIQQKIAGILSAYDELIENNLKRIKLLEEMAQITYEEWFVRLRFPGHESTPIDAETGLPEGWNKKQIQDIGDVVTGKTPSTTNPDFFGNDVPFIKTPDMAYAPYVIRAEQSLSNLGADSQKKKYLPKNSLMVSCIGTVGVTGLVAIPSQTNQQINSIVFKNPIYTYFMYCLSRRLKPWLEALGSNGATMTNVNKGKFETIEFDCPKLELLEKFHASVSSNFDAVLNLQFQNQQLREARDILLPRMMTGAIDVESALSRPAGTLSRTGRGEVGYTVEG